MPQGEITEYLCPKCNTEFDDRTLYCEDWRIKEKKFGCPHCKTFFYKSIETSFNWKKAIIVFIAISIVNLASVYYFKFNSWHIMPVVMTFIIATSLGTQHKTSLKEVSLTGNEA